MFCLNHAALLRECGDGCDVVEVNKPKSGILVHETARRVAHACHAQLAVDGFDGVLVHETFGLEAQNGVLVGGEKVVCFQRAPHARIADALLVAGRQQKLHAALQALLQRLNHRRNDPLPEPVHIPELRDVGLAEGVGAAQQRAAARRHFVRFVAMREAVQRAARAVVVGHRARFLLLVLGVTRHDAVRAGCTHAREMVYTTQAVVCQIVRLLGHGRGMGRT